ncbi:MAG: hypothetical protein IT561_25995 [Alphaproteobacteria bacterium]|nr:hypothetical protein [Alphaproteobacteria bacterium]
MSGTSDAKLAARFPPPEAFSHLAGDDWPAEGPVAADAAAQRAFARDQLGPVFFQFCQRLHIAALAFEGRQAGLFFVARGGLRLRWLYALWCRRTGTAPALPMADLFISRVAAAKGCLARDFAGVAPALVREFANGSLGYMLRCLVRGRAVDLPGILAHCPATVPAFAEVYGADDALGMALRGYFADQSRLLGCYLDGALGAIRTPVLVDSGWTGGTQAMLMRHFPERDWHGLYFGRWDYGRGPGAHFGHIFGVAVDSLEPHTNTAGQAIFTYNHLIEDPLEIAVPSVEGYRADGPAGAVPEGEAITPSVLAPGPGDAMFSGIVDHFEAMDAASGEFLAVERRAHAAYRRLRRMILWPRPAELPAMLVRPRSADFGRSLAVPVLLGLPPGAGLRRRLKSVGAALWRPGQVVVAFPRLHWAINGAHYLLRRTPYIWRHVAPLLGRGERLLRRLLRR